MMLRDRYLGTGLGLFWAIVQPLLAHRRLRLCVHLSFSRTVWGSRERSELSFIIWMISGYGPWLAINEGLMGGATSVTGQAALVKNMAFKTELLPIAATALGLVPLLVQCRDPGRANPSWTAERPTPAGRSCRRSGCSDDLRCRAGPHAGRAQRLRSRYHICAAERSDHAAVPVSDLLPDHALS